MVSVGGGGGASGLPLDGGPLSIIAIVLVLALLIWLMTRVFEF